MEYSVFIAQTNIKLEYMSLKPLHVSIVNIESICCIMFVKSSMTQENKWNWLKFQINYICIQFTE